MQGSFCNLSSASWKWTWVQFRKILTILRRVLAFFHTCKSENKSLLVNNIIIVVVSCIFKLYLGSYRMKKTIIILYRQIPVVKSIRSHNSYRSIESLGSLSISYHRYFEYFCKYSYVAYTLFIISSIDCRNRFILPTNKKCLISVSKL